VVRRGHTHWYRILHGGIQLDRLTSPRSSASSAEADIDMADLVEVTDQLPGPVANPGPGVAQFPGIA
jgi:hypothetical protein